MKKYLFIVEKPSLIKTIEKVYLENKESLGYIADFTHVIAPVGHVNDRIRIVNLEDGNWNKLVLKNSEIPEDYYIYNKNMPVKFDELKLLIENGDYDLIINAYDADILGQLEYEFAKEYTGFSIPDKRMICKDLTDKAIITAFQNFEDNKEYLNKLLSEL